MDGWEATGLAIDVATLGAAADRIVPGDAFPSATEAGVLRALAERAMGPARRLWERAIVPGLADLDGEAMARHGRPFAELATEQQNELLRDVEGGRAVGEWVGNPARFVASLVRVVTEAYYGADRSPAWAMVGFDPSPKRASGLDVAATRPATTPFGQLDSRPDVVIVGAGAGGGTAAAVLAEAGLRVLLVDRGDVLAYEDIPRDHLANHRLGVYGHGTGPDAEGHPRVHVDERGRERMVEHPWDDRYNVHNIG